MATSSRRSRRSTGIHPAVPSVLPCRLTTLCLLAILGAGALLPRAASGAEAQVRVRGGEHAGFARLVFDWPRAVSYEAGIEAGELVISFGATAVYDVSVLDHDLEDYIDGRGVRQDGAAIRFPLKGRFGLKHFTIGPKVVVDLVEGGGAPPRQDPMRADPAPSKDMPPPASREPLSESSASRTEAPTAPPVATAAEPMKDEPPSDAAALDRPTGDVLLDSAAPVQLLPEQLAEQWRSALAGGRGPAAPPAATAPLPEVELPTALTAGTGATVEPLTGAEGQGGEGQGGEGQSGEGQSGEGQSGEGQGGEGQGGEGQGGEELGGEELGGEELGGEELGGEGAAETSPLVDVTETEVESEWVPIPGRDLRPEPAAAFALNFTTATAMATFRRGSHLWFVFDRPLPDGISRRIEETVPGARSVEQFEVEGATVIRLRVPGQLAPRLFQEQAAWKVDLRPRNGRPETPVRYSIDEDLDGASLRVLMPGGTRAIHVSDPELGDRLAIVPVNKQGVGVSKEIRLAQLSLLPTFQGLVVELRDDGLALGVSDLEIAITAPGGLVASVMAEPAVQAGEGPAAILGQRLFDLPAWRRSPDALSRNYKQALLTRINTTSGREADLARQDLARFYFAHGLALEALSLLELMEQTAPELVGDPELVLMKGASQALAEDYAGARRTLSNPILAHEWEALPWQAAVAAIAQEWDYAAWAFEQSNILIADYVQPVRTRLQLLAAEARLGIGDQEGVTYYLKRIRPLRLSQSERAQVDFIEAGRRLLDDRFGTAQPLLRKVASGPHAATRVRARLALIDLKAAQPGADRQSIIADLERLRFAWRGDAFESALERRLAEAYYQEGEIRKALVILDSVAEFGPDPVIAAAADHRARAIFEELYVDRPENGPSPLTAVALYQEFRHLAPVGEDGVAMVDGLIEQLVGVDLLDRAAALLESQIQFNLSGEAKARAGARLARIRLDDHLPNRALDALDGSALDDLPEDLVRSRLLLRAEALAGLGRGDQALAELAQDPSDASLRMQAVLLRKQEQWEQAGVVLGLLRPDLQEAGATVGPQAAADLANLAIAYTMTGDSEALRELALSYQGALPPGRDGETFDLLTTGVDGEMLTTVAGELEGASRIHTLLTSLRNELR